MKLSILRAFVVLLVAHTVTAAPVEKLVEIVRQDADVVPESYEFGFETSDGTQHEEEGQLKIVGTDSEAITVKGSYKYVGDDGVTYNVSYTADEHGFQPLGDHLPKA
ncbi:PREDICTED: larval cuticle protein 8-like [Bactrocera latifrons]|uniref:larval cuticle protein 8-like n=1 Tax=Bactrocera latifrons TaxID=174628 RepID=UPI0008DD330C|nr:PREDICTED: larval cuticle protein 8-like [Bactrocera latifrons]